MEPEMTVKIFTITYTQTVYLFYILRSLHTGTLQLLVLNVFSCIKIAFIQKMQLWYFCSSGI